MFTYNNDCTYCDRLSNMLMVFECLSCGKEIMECQSCHQSLPPIIKNKKMCKFCFVIKKFSKEGKLPNGK